MNHVLYLYASKFLALLGATLNHIFYIPKYEPALIKPRTHRKHFLQSI